MPRKNLNRNSKRTTTLCDLPGDVLRRILSLLPTPDAVRMSMASKGLGSSFRSIPKLEFDFSYYSKKARRGGRRFDRRPFMDMVERSLRARDDGSSITEFSLSCLLVECFDVSRVVEWISDVVLRHNVQDLCLFLLRAPLSTLKDPIKLLPSCIFQSEKLRKLDLYGTGALPIPHRVYLPNLKDLALRGVRIVDQELTGKLLSSPSLEKLSFEGCSFFEPITVSAPMLNTISVSPFALPQYACPDLAIHAPNLKHISYKCGLDKRFVISGSPVLDEVDIRLLPWKDVSNNLRRLLQDISCVKNDLTLCSDVLQQLKGHNDPFPEFSNLRNLNLIRDNSYFEERPYIFLDSDPLCSLLGRCPSIETLEFYMDAGLDAEPPPPERYQGPFPSNLKKVTINHFSGSDRQLLAVRFLLMRAPVLEELVLKYGRYLPEPKLLDELYFSTLPRISERCRIRIVPAPIQ